jgi:hypothetical protein
MWYVGKFVIKNAYYYFLYWNVLNKLIKFNLVTDKNDKASETCVSQELFIIRSELKNKN